jgi:ATP-dependent exoDNAse (exonuclease V) beta subunit
LPNLHRKVSVDQQRLLLWLESPTQSREDTLLLAPIKAASEDQEPIYEYLKMIEKSKADHESQRLLYVAATRAKESLHLIGKVVSDLEDPTKLKKPAAGSFLDILWPFCHDEIIKNIISHESKLMSEERTVVKLRRLVSNWQSPLEISSGDCSE